MLDLTSHVCTLCEDAVEPELLAVMPDVTICLDCMDPGQRRQLEADLQTVQQINRSLLPSSVPAGKSLEIGLHYVPSRLISGDFFDMMEDPDSGHLLLAAGDVAGKGIPAGLLRAGIQATLRVLSQQGLSPARLLELANRHLLALAQPNRYATVFFGAFDRSRGLLHYANGGHLPPLIRRECGTWERLEATGTPLGILADVPYTQGQCEFGHGDLLVLYTDGITETENGLGDVFDEHRLTRAVDRRVGEGSIQQHTDHIATELARFSPGEPADDRMLVLLRQS